MNEEVSIARLLSWDADTVIPREHYDRLERNPRYSEAVHALSARLLAAAQQDAAFDIIAKDAGRFVAAQWALNLEVSGALTLPRLKEISAASGLLSRGRARGTLLLLRYLGYIEPVAWQVRPARYRLTPALLRVWSTLTRERLEAVSLIEPAIRLILNRLDDRSVLDCFLQHQGNGLFKAASAMPQKTQFFRVFLHRNAGMQTLHFLIETAAASRDRFPPERPIPISISRMAAQLRVSRTHIKRLFRDAEREGLLRQVDENAVQFTEILAREARFIISSSLLGLLICAAKTMRDLSVSPKFNVPPPRGKDAV